MGIYLNPENTQYAKLTKNIVFVDHTLLLDYMNQKIGTESCYVCVSRPRRFGKSTDANMLVAYYSKGCDSHALFDGLKIGKTKGYVEHLNQHNVIYLNMQKFLSNSETIDGMIRLLTSEIIEDVNYELSIKDFSSPSLSLYLEKISQRMNLSFIFIIDEWDCIFREYKNKKEDQKLYLDFLRNLLKDQPYVELAYMTGILPIKKYGTHSAINMFEEISMLNPEPYSCFMGFTEDEVKQLCKQFNVDFNMMQKWYDGYHLTNTISTFSPRSVVSALSRGRFDNYWTQTETYEALKIYIDMNYDGLKDAIIQLLAGENVPINPERFQNDMTTFASKDDVLTLMIHLGYLGYNQEESTCYIPNKEVMDSFVTAIKNSSNMKMTAIALKNSQELLKATFNKEEEKVASYIEQAHLETSHLTYNDENALAYTISLAYYTARDSYTIVREYPTGKGYADIAFIPKKDVPAMLVELKWKKDAKTALTQIKEKQYPKGLEKYADNLLLVGINYDPKTRKHTCSIEKNV